VEATPSSVVYIYVFINVFHYYFLLFTHNYFMLVV
jgi:hypothetical protein